MKLRAAILEGIYSIEGSQSAARACVIHAPVRIYSECQCL